MSLGQSIKLLCTLILLHSAAAYAGLPQKVPNERREPIPLIAPDFWITVTDYPMHAALDGQEGDVETELTVTENGRVSECVIISSSGDPRLDRKTCKLLVQRARFKPALDKQKRPVTGVYRFSHSWRIPPSRGLSDADKTATQYSSRR
ncbi:MAG: energy transducer TonB [Pseudomonadota bacterium]